MRTPLAILLASVALTLGAPSAWSAEPEDYLTDPEVPAEASRVMLGVLAENIVLAAESPVRMPARWMETAEGNGREPAQAQAGHASVERSQAPAEPAAAGDQPKTEAHSYFAGSRMVFAED